MKRSKKSKAFELFSQGYTPTSPEVKELGLHPTNRYKYFTEWQKLGKPADTESRHSQTAMVSSKSPSGETIGGIDETKAKPEKEQKEKPQPEEALSQEEEISEGVGGQERKIPITVAEEGIKCTVSLSLQTLVLYKIAAAKQAQYDNEEELNLGDFLDTCAEDFFRVRGKALGLIEYRD